MPEMQTAFHLCHIPDSRKPADNHLYQNYCLHLHTAECLQPDPSQKDFLLYPHPEVQHPELYFRQFLPAAFHMSRHNLPASRY